MSDDNRAIWVIELEDYRGEWLPYANYRTEIGAIKMAQYHKQLRVVRYVPEKEEPANAH